MKTYLIPTSTAKHLVKTMSSKSNNFKVVFPGLNRDGKRYFPDGETYLKILEAKRLKGKRIIVLHSGAPRPNEGLVELELILQILRDNKINPEVFFTYFPYGMQDKVFEKGETNVAENLIEKLVNYYKVKKIYVVDPHFGGKSWTKKYSIISISAVPFLIKMVLREFGQNILFLAPDKGGKRRTGFKAIKKVRENSFGVKMFPSGINLKGKIVAVVDDIVETGGTLLKFYQVVKKLGAKKVIALTTHGVLSSGIIKIKKRYSKLYITNTIKQKKANIDITDLVLDAILEYG